MSCDISNSIDQFVKGNTFTLAGVYKQDGTPSSLVDLDIRSQVRDSSGELVEDLIAAKANQTTNPGVFTLSSADTSLWPLDVLACDIQFIDINSGNRRNSTSFTIQVIEGVTDDN